MNAFHFEMKTITDTFEVNQLAVEIINARLAQGNNRFGIITYGMEDIKNVEATKSGNKLYFKVQLKNGIIEDHECTKMPMTEILAIERFTSTQLRLTKK